MDSEDLRAKASADGSNSTVPPGNLNPSFPHDRNLALNEVIGGLDLRETLTDYSKALQDILVLHDSLAFQHEQNGEYKILPEAAARISDYVVKITVPPTLFAEQPLRLTDGKGSSPPGQVAEFHQLSHYALTCLSFTALEVEEDELASVLTSVAAFTDTNDPWTTTKTHEVACKLIHRIAISHGNARMEELLGAILRDSVRPAFAKTKNTKLTQQARRAMHPVQSRTVDTGDDADQRPWKYRALHIPTVFRWVLLQLRGTDVSGRQLNLRLPISDSDHKSRFVEDHWPFLVPPILALIDDSSLRYKAAGCADLVVFLQSCPVDVLERTGLGEIFENAIMPGLMYLPTLTEEAESLMLLSKAYPALLELAALRFPRPGQRLLKVKALDRIMRYGILNGFSHAAEHVRIADFLTKQLIGLISSLGIDTAKHLKSILALLSTSLADPFLSTYPPLLLASAQALERLILACWPRVANTRGELIKLLTLAWSGAEDISAVSSDLVDIRKQLGTSLSLLITSVGITCTTFTDELDELSKQDACFRRLLQAQR